MTADGSLGLLLGESRQFAGTSCAGWSARSRAGREYRVSGSLRWWPVAFEVESVSFDVIFEDGGGGTVQRMRVTGTPPVWGCLDGVFERA
jgi:hypothetical protein